MIINNCVVDGTVYYKGEELARVVEFSYEHTRTKTPIYTLSVQTPKPDDSICGNVILSYFNSNLLYDINQTTLSPWFDMVLIHTDDKDCKSVFKVHGVEFINEGSTLKREDYIRGTPTHFIAASFQDWRPM